MHAWDTRGDVTLQTYGGCANNSADESQKALGKQCDTRIPFSRTFFKNGLFSPKRHAEWPSFSLLDSTEFRSFFVSFREIYYPITAKIVQTLFTAWTKTVNYAITTWEFFFSYILNKLSNLSQVRSSHHWSWSLRCVCLYNTQNRTIIVTLIYSAIKAACLENYY